MKRIRLVLMAAAVMVVMVVAAVPAIAQTAQEEAKEAVVAKAEGESPKVVAEEAKEAQKAKAKEEAKKDLPKSGGMTVSGVALLGLGAGALLVGGGLVVRRIAR